MKELTIHNQKNKDIITFSLPAKKAYFLSFTLSLVAILILFFLYTTQKTSLHTTTSTLLNPALIVIEKKNRIIDFQELREYLTNTYEQREDYMVSIYFEYLPTGANIAVNKDEKIWPASLIKIPVAMSVMKKVQDKKWQIENELVILDEDKDSEYGVLYKEPTGTTLTIQTFLEKTLIDSDNTAHFVLLRNLDGGELEDVYVHLGLDDVIETLKKSPKKETEADNRITAKRYSIFFRSLYNATYLDQEHSELFLEILKQAPRDLLGNGIPKEIPFVHKTGVRIDEAVRADSGIVYAHGRPYIITVMIQKKKGALDEKEVGLLFEDISRKIYHYVTRDN